MKQLRIVVFSQISLKLELENTFVRDYFWPKNTFDPFDPVQHGLTDVIFLIGQQCIGQRKRIDLALTMQLIRVTRFDSVPALVFSWDLKL